MALINFLKSFFDENYIVDDREPSFAFQIPTIDGEFLFFAPNPGPWKQLLFFNLLQTVIQIAFACFIYEGIVKRRGTIGSFIIGWGFIIPASVYLPFYFLDVLDLRNKVLCLGSSTAMSVIFFRCIEAMYGTSPDVVELSISNYCGYYGNLAPYVWSTKTKQRERITGMQLIRSIMERLFNFIALSLLLSILIHYKYKPFEDTVEWASLTITQDILSTGNLYNSYLITCKSMQSTAFVQSKTAVQAWQCSHLSIHLFFFNSMDYPLRISTLVLLYFALNNIFELNAFGENAKGFATEPVFDAPLTQSKTPTEFWTARWNYMTHRLLKGGIFEPAKLCFKDKKAPMFLTFVASGLYHEYVWTTIFYNQKYLYDENGVCANEEDCYEFKFGRVTAFFAYAAIVMLLERPMKKLALVQWLSSYLPTLVIAQLLVCIHVPVVKWYGGDWVEGGFFDDLSIMFILLRRV